MKILCVIDSLTSGGAQRQLVELSKALQKEHNDVSFLTYYSDEFYLKEISEFNIKYSCIIEPNYLIRLCKMRRYIRHGSYDVVISFLEASGFICQISGFPFRTWTLIVGERSANPNIKKSFKLILYRWFHFFSDFVVANSYKNLKIVKEISPFLSKRKCKVIYNSIDFNKWKSDPTNYVFRKNNKFILLIAASHQHLKNLDGLIEGVNLLSKSLKDQLHIHWYGKSNMDNSYFLGKQKIKKYNLNSNFYFFDATLEIEERMKEADGIGLFSHYEGLPNTVCEGMALGKPIIATNVSDISLFIEDNVSGFLCEANDPSTIANSLEKLLELSEEEIINMGIANRKIAFKYFNIDSIVKEYQELWENE